jgi:glycosyltransferase 2 family protein
VTAPSPGRRRALTAVRRAYAAVVVVAVVYVLATRGGDVADLVGSGRPLLLAACLLAAYGQLLLTSAVWTSGLRALGTPVPWTTAVLATAESAPARYLPGSVWYAVSRGVALQRTGVPVRALAAVATLETLLVPVLGFALGAVLLSLSGVAFSGALSVPVLLVAVGLLALASPPVVNAALRYRAGDDPPLRLSWPALLRLVAWLTVFWLWSGSVFALYVSAFPDATDLAWPGVVGAYMVAWGVGWLAVFAPQGVGVFELVLVGLLAGGGAGLALVLAGYRALVVVRDLSAAGVAVLLRRRATR